MLGDGQEKRDEVQTLQLYHSTVGTVLLQWKTVRKRTLTFSQNPTFDKLMHCSMKHVD